jgi:hypothetical protein
VDTDGDGHGDPNMAMSAPCSSQPAGAVMTADDCNDRDKYIYPGAAEVCDGADSDCNAATAETCPANCTPLKRPSPDDASTYLFCNDSTGWVSAQAICASVAGFHLIQVDDTGENTWLRSTASSMFGGTAEVHLGANDREAEGVWRWDGSNVQFWQGAGGGATVGGGFADWNAGEPSNSQGIEDCGRLRAAGNWDDRPCTDQYPSRYVCER